MAGDAGADTAGGWRLDMNEETLIAILHRAAERLREAGLPVELAERMEGLATQVRHPCVVAVVGRVKVGKSTFVNALLGEDLAKVGTTETTATINYFTYGQPRPRAPRPLSLAWREGHRGEQGVSGRLARERPRDPAAGGWHRPSGVPLAQPSVAPDHAGGHAGYRGRGGRAPGSDGGVHAAEQPAARPPRPGHQAARRHGGCCHLSRWPGSQGHGSGVLAGVCRDHRWAIERTERHRCPVEDRAAA